MYYFSHVYNKYGRFLENGSKKQLQNGSERIGIVKNLCRFLLRLSRSITVPFPRSLTGSRPPDDRSFGRLIAVPLVKVTVI